MEPLKVFVVEDEEVTAKVLAEALLKERNCEVEIFPNGSALLENLHKNPDVISLDYYLPDYNGRELFKRIKKFNAEIPVIIVSGQKDISTAIDLLHKGACDYVVKDRNMRTRLSNLIHKIEEKKRLETKIAELEEELGRKYLEHNTLKGNSPVMQKVFELIQKAARSNITVSITGETGTGKELVAKAIHYNSLRRKGKFVAFNVAAIPKELIESELFGHEKGSFTGAIGRRVGKFEEADQGTLFLDEIADMDLSMQVKLLRAIQEGEFTRVGGNEIIKFDARLIVATHKNLAQEVKAGNFRADLYYRIMGLPIELPPLRERGNDILLLARYFLDDFCQKNGIAPKSLSPAAQEKLLNYSFPGNVRELKALMELGCVLASSQIIEAEDINIDTQKTTQPGIDFTQEKSLDDYIDDIVKNYLIKYNGSVKEVAERLQVGKTTIYRMLKRNPELAALASRS
ncbi:MAG: hypothetical protein PWR20_2195 [Bacteroidales bacterium]|jgi:DNA-binding NtrC family response regulator|nr:hypothetical protein [Bacteroidales bacterium]MDN5328230.1 hypothetical protein [Bacteroidales bacterium]